ncbi:MAG: hotdog domain-containing protein [Actinomycetota bacterium]|nr:hotdog domain-containing protein [Actinomycetota bacterium]
MELKTGLRGTAFLKVEKSDLSIAFNSGEVPVLATPRVVALIEEATLDAISGNLEKNKTTVGMRVRIDHLTPISLGGSITAHAILEQVDGRRLTFSATVETEKGKLLVANATITRVIVDTEEFLNSAKP